MFDIDLFMKQVRILIQDREDIYKKFCEDICECCKNKVECNPEKCEGYIEGDKGYLNGKITKFKWDCMDFDYGTCEMMQHTPCFQCFENDYSGFQYNDNRYDFEEALKQLEELFQKGMIAND